jgi:hypothetical protein
MNRTRLTTIICVQQWITDGGGSEVGTEGTASDRTIAASPEVKPIGKADRICLASYVSRSEGNPFNTKAEPFKYAILSNALSCASRLASAATRMRLAPRSLSISEGLRTLCLRVAIFPSWANLQLLPRSSLLRIDAPIVEEPGPPCQQ